jgi:thioesterase domain-containing protein
VELRVSINSEQTTDTPRTLVEQSLVEIWNTTLDRSDVAPTHNFFEIGGDSLLALVTIEQINQRLGWKLNFSDLLRHPNIRELIARRGAPQAAHPERTIVRMSNRGGETPMIFIHPVSGLLFPYSKLVHHLRQDRGCYGLQSPILTGASVPSALEDLAEVYADLLADEFGEDEFHLVGWAAGGVIAFEVAKLASAKSLGLQKLVLIDSHIQHGGPSETTEEMTLRAFRDDLLAQVFPDARDEATTPLRDDPAAVFADVATALFGAEAQRAGDAGTEFVTRLYDAYRASSGALTAYRPAPAAVDALLLHTKANGTLDTWRGVMQGELTVAALDCDHHGLLRERDVATIATQIHAYCQ